MPARLVSFLFPALALAAPLAVLPAVAQTQSQIAAHTQTQPGPRDARIASTVPYAGTSADPLTMDVYNGSGPAPHPAVMIVHGGGFTSGTSRNGSEAYAADFLAPAGYTCFSINYSLAPAPFSQSIADVQRAIRFVRHNARQYNIDPDKIALLGGSAGGYLSNMVGLLPPAALSTSADPVDHETDAVEAVITLYGIADWNTMPNTTVISENHLLGASTPVSPETLAAASPLAHVTNHAPPVLLIHGDKDASVPIQQSIRLQAALRAHGDAADLITVPNGPHATGSWHTIPGVPDWERQTVQWLNTTLDHTGPIGEGIVPRTPAQPSTQPSAQTPAKSPTP